MALPVVVGIDGTAESLAAADWAADEALRRGLPLSLVYAWDPQRLADVPLALSPAAQQQAAEGLVRDAEREVRARHPDVPVTAEAVTGPEVAALTARSEDAAMLVLGSRALGPVVGFLVGSIGLKVLKGARCPVVMVRNHERAAGPATGAVVVGVQETGEAAAPVLSYAFETAAARGAGVRAVRAWSLPTVFSFRPSTLRRADEHGGIEEMERQALADTLAPWRERYPQVPVEQHLDLGSAPEVLLTSATDAQLLVIGRRARPGGFRHIGPVAHAVLHLAQVPVAVIAGD
ncbi:universal stress protein UspA [Streptomyces sp. Ru73]|uniref:universal stress protein n=1 Tax=Streptomyces sp. Ru73 TaxID=2080748 RepID=UPI000CDDB2EB|nr:universal stress protein [Streptomyces sp. Ru73]POX38600.1 universal stress protein UspA [Streptomyces sp. Ru73]